MTTQRQLGRLSDLSDIALLLTIAQAQPDPATRAQLERIAQRIDAALVLTKTVPAVRGWSGC